MVYRVQSNAGGLSRLKVEINTREHAPYFKHVKKPFSLENEWFSGRAQITKFLVEEILSTKFRALLQRDKGRDVFDLGRAIDEFDGMDLEAVVKGMTHNLDMSGI
jgi:predicted nucleotidyltransferase component of viral defense system